MIDLYELNLNDYIEYANYEMSNEDIDELREICYMRGSDIPLAEFFNDIEQNRDPRYNKKHAYKDLAVLVQYIMKLED